MQRTVEIRNVTNSNLTFCGKTVFAHGRLILSIAEYIGAVSENDVPDGLMVTFPDVELRKVSVREFGAKGDGVSDDTYAIQSAIDSVAAYGGGIVNVPVGVYLISGITLHGNVSMQGDSMVASVIRQKANSDMAIVSISGGSCMLSDLRLNGAETITPITKTSLIDGFMNPTVRNDVGWSPDQVYITWVPDGTWYRYATGSIAKTKYGVKFTYADANSGMVLPLVSEGAVNVGDTVTLKFSYRCSTTLTSTNDDLIYFLNNPTPNSSQKLEGISFEASGIWREFEHTWTAIKSETATGPFDAMLIGWTNPGAGEWLEIKDGSAILTKDE